MNGVVADPENSAACDRSVLLPDADSRWVRDSPQLRTPHCELTFQRGVSVAGGAGHHGLLADSGLRSATFRDHEGHVRES